MVMGYPLTSDFASSADYSAWWQYARSSGEVDICASTGATIVLRARAAIQLDAGPWDATFQGRLLDVARGISAPVLMELQRDLSRGEVGPVSLAFAIWLAWYRKSGLGFVALRIPAGFVPPAWGRPITARQVPVVCWNPALQSSPEKLSVSQIAIAVQESVSGARGGDTATASRLSRSDGSVGGVLMVLAGAAAVVIGAAVLSRQR